MSQAREIGLFSALTTGGSAMTRSNYGFVLRRASERVVASLGALALTTLMLVSVNAHAAAPRALKPSVTILVPTVTIEAVDEDPTQPSVR
jgi:hypothetical protein